MQVSEEVRKCVMFVGCKTTNGTKWGGTAFSVGVKAKNSETQSFNYIVTARHVIEKIKNVTLDNKVLLRVNDQKGSAQTVATLIEDWRFHPTDDSIDAAVLPVALPQDIFDNLFIGSENALTDEIIKKDAIGPGDEIFLTGLFKSHYGKQKNLPIIRVGNIALISDEKVRSKIFINNFGYKEIDMDAYLVEARSIGGLSGSPVFIHMGLWRSVNKSTTHGAPSGKAFHWLGLMHGHWDISENAIDDIFIEANNSGHVNMGIGIVVPANKIMEVIDQLEFKEARDKKEDELRKQNSSK